MEIEGESVRARIYPWGIAEVDNPDHSDFVRLRGAILGCDSIHVCFLNEFVQLMLSRSHLNDLKSLTEDVLYETYRTEKLSKTVTDNRYVLWNVFHEIANCGPLVSHKFFLRI